MKRALAIDSVARALASTHAHANGEISRGDGKGGSHVVAGVIDAKGVGAWAVECSEAE